MAPAFLRFTPVFSLIRPFPLGSRPVSLPHNLTVSHQSHFEAKKADFGPKSLDSLRASTLRL